MMPRLSCHFVMGGLGLLMGFTLSRTGFSSWGEVHRMFVFEDLRLTLTFACAVMISFLAFRLFARNQALPARRIHPGSIPGGVLLGVGWAVCGACPAIVWVQLGEGQLTALVPAAGIVLGIWIYPLVHARFFRWQSVSCSE